MSSTSLAGQVAIVTGASRGIGRGISVHLARQGAAVAGIARQSEDLASLRRAAGQDAGDVLPVPADVASPGEVEAAFGVVRMLAAGSGRFVTIYGNLGDRQLGNVSAFAVAKAGIARLTESLACELAGTQVPAFAAHPGFVRTPMTERLARGEDGRTWLPGFGAGAETRWGDCQPAADLVEAIARGAADHLAGRVLRAGDDLETLLDRCRSDPDLRRLRLSLD